MSEILLELQSSIRNGESPPIEKLISLEEVRQASRIADEEFEKKNEGYNYKILNTPKMPNIGKFAQFFYF
ncbi:hypothetical protein A3C57_02760 [Candidatus Nomurabacteria bacterium RIFCSPHIGHO2_02_FULL_33_12]|nr:MAG: hypothetical protein A3C57_02760 [Candidatus Nomurabacteria bacterium RIFCSPHIGHO2_02_FULL_33_12]